MGTGHDTTTAAPTPGSPAAVPAPRPGGRDAAAAVTRADLLRAAGELFGAHGYGDTSLESVVQAAGVTKGALYHHFDSKRELFAAVLEQTQQHLVAEVLRRLSPEPDPPQPTRALRVVLEASRSPRYQQVVLRDGPAVLGARAQAPDGHPGFPAVVDFVRSMLGAEFDIEQDTLEALARLLLGALTTAATAIAGAQDPEDEQRRCEATLSLLLASLERTAQSYRGLDAVLTELR